MRGRPRSDCRDPLDRRSSRAQRPTPPTARLILAPSATCGRMPTDGYGRDRMNPSPPASLRAYLSVLWTRKWKILAIMATTTAVVLVYSSRQIPSYSSTAEVLVRSPRFDRNPSAPTPPMNMLTEERVANSREVADIAATYLPNRTDGTSAAAVIREGTETIEFTAQAADPAVAHVTANAFAKAYLELRRRQAIRELEALRSGYLQGLAGIREHLTNIAASLALTDNQVERSLLTSEYTSLLTRQSALEQSLSDLIGPQDIDVGEVLVPASLPTSPSGANLVSNITLGIVLGLTLGVATALLLDRLDQRVRDRAELESYSRARVLAIVPRVRAEQPPPITAAQPMSEAAEAYKALGVRLLYAASDRKVKTVLVTSSLEGEGKTSTTANLGVALAVAGKRTVMVSADLRRPALQEYFFSLKQAGLTDVLSGIRKTSEVVGSTGKENLWLLGSGTGAGSVSPLELLSSKSMRDVITELRSFGDFVLIDTPPVLTAPDVAALAPFADAVLFVVDPRRADRVVVEQARYELQLMNVPVIGVVVNNFTPRTFRTYGTGYGRYSTDGTGHPIVGEPSQAIVRAEDTDGGSRS